MVKHPCGVIICVVYTMFRGFRRGASAFFRNTGGSGSAKWRASESFALPRAVRMSALRNQSSARMIVTALSLKPGIKLSSALLAELGLDEEEGGK